MLTTSLRIRSLGPALAASICVLGCTTNGLRGDLFISKAVRPTLAGGATGSSCELNAGTAESAFGSVDPNVAPVYLIGLVVNNNLANNGNAAAGRLNTNNFQVEQARINYDFPDPAFHPSIGEHVVPANGYVQSGQTQAVGVQAFPSDVIGALKGALAGGSGTVRIHTHLEGRLADGSSIKTAEYEYAVKICAGCGTPAPVCASPKNPVSCAPGQDADVACQ
jgi:hypothetical protein